MGAGTKAESVYFSANGRVVIPRRLRKEFEIEAGTRAHVESTPEGILIKPVTLKFIHSLRGSLKGKGVMKAMMADRKFPEFPAAGPRLESILDAEVPDKYTLTD